MNTVDSVLRIKKYVYGVIAVLLGLLIASVAIEVSFFLYYYIKDDRYISVAERLSREENAYVQETLAAGQGCRYVDTLFPHPYLAFVHHRNPPCGILGINNIGLFGPDFPNEKDESKFVILLTGGSVAAQFGQVKRNGPKWLQDILNKRYVAPRGQEFVILNGADGAWKQPQQTILFLFYADVLDGLITLDGFNEHYMINSRLRFEYPANNFFRVNPLASDSYAPLLGVWLSNRLYTHSRNNWLLSRSYAAYFATTRIRGALRRYSLQTRRQGDSRTSVESIFALPEEWGERKRFEWSIGQYKKYIRAMDAVAAKMNIVTAYFVQPVPAIEKKLTREERAVVGDLGYKEKYASMTRQLLKLNDQGIPVFSLLDLFKDRAVTIYADHAHFRREPTGESLGYRLMAERIAKILERTWDLKRKGD